MGETSKYFVPERGEQFLGKEREIAEAFWTHGVFLVTPGDFIYRRMAEWKAAGRPLPACSHNFTFASMGLSGSLLYEPVPNSIYDLLCPKCHSDITEAAYDAWNDDDSPSPLPERTVDCGQCGASSPSQDLTSQETPFTLATFYLWVSDIELSDWDPSFMATVEQVLGPCKEFTSWET